MRFIVTCSNPLFGVKRTSEQAPSLGALIRCIKSWYDSPMGWSVSVTSYDGQRLLARKAHNSSRFQHARK